MTLKKSSVNPFEFTFRKTLSKSFWIPLGLLLLNSCMVLSDIVSFINRYNEYLKTDPETAASMLNDTVFKLSLSGETLLQIIWSILTIVASVATAASVFRFMMNKSAVNVWYSLGMTRSKLFWARYLAGALALTVSSVLPFVISVILNIHMFGSSTELWISALYMVLCFWTLSLLSYGIAACTFCGVGTNFEGVFFSLVYCVMPAIAEMFIEVCHSNFLYGSPTTSESWSNMGQVSVLGAGYHVFTFKNLGILDFTFFHASTDYANKAAMNVYDKFYADFTTPLIAFVLVVMVAFIALSVHNRRKTEIAGFLGTNPLATGIVVFTSALLVITFLMMHLVDVEIKNYFISAVIAILIFAVIYFIADAVSLRSMKLIFKKLWKLPIHLGVFFGIILIFTTGLFGYSSKIPEYDDIESVSISTNTADMFVDYENLSCDSSNYLFTDYSIDDFLAIGNGIVSAAGNFTDSLDIMKIISIHEQLINCKGLEVNSENICLPYDERVVPVNIAVIYNLKDGTTFERVYFVATEKILCQLANLTLTEHYKTLAVETLENGFNKYRFDESNMSDYSLYVLSPNMSQVTSCPEMDKDDIFRLFEEVAKDIKNDTLPLNFRSDSDILGYIKVSWQEESRVYYSEEVYGDIKTFTENVIGEVYIEESEDTKLTEAFNLNEKSEGIRASGTGLLIPVYADMTNTAAFAESNGLTQYFNDTAKPVEAKVWRLDESAESENLWKYSSMTSLTAGFWSNGKTASENEAAKGEKIEDVVHYDYYNSLPDLPETAVTVTDEAEIEKLQKKARMLALTCYDGEYVQFIFEDGSMTFGYIPA